MTTFIQAHILTTYVPSNLNRDDTNRPKTSNFGGVPRLRISSQCLKRTWRTGATFHGLFDGQLGHRTRLMGEVIRDRMIAFGMSKEDAVLATQSLVSQFGKLETGQAKVAVPNDADGNEVAEEATTKPTKKSKAEAKPKPDMKENVKLSQLYFMSREEMAALEAVADRIAAGEVVSDKEKQVISNVLSAPDIGLFGRMVAATPMYNVEAAVQVSHAITTHRVIPDEDFYTAVDDLNHGNDDVGAGFMGTFEFGGGVFYTYVNVDRDQLVTNLQGDEDLADRSISTLLQAATQESPKGKISSFAQQSRAEYILVERGSQQPRNLGYAFLKPVSANDADGDLMAASIKRLKEFHTNTEEVYGPSAESSYVINLSERTNSITGLRNWLAGRKEGA